ncbi:PspC domain-containing protein [Leucobacter denitrificans]|uniref:PspC domain-containing protein n=1 Tax=Leucobacter denitrificans TaxID=683042 RepID=A0A7G9S3T9_9MICO|nr:PspC domain-containing protein [Leucobacter denitrificans]QNN62514.1 PspC domain-containing protein [Leucobacter denitrificans]
MNEQTPSSGAGQAPFGSGFFNWLRGLRIERGSDRWFAGVAGGIAQRAGIDPLIVRGIFVVLALLGGPGILLYLAGWLLLPGGNGRIHLEEVFRGRGGTAAVVVTVAVGAIIVLPFLFGTPFGSWSLWNVLGIPEWLSTLTIVLVWIVAVTAAIILAGQLFLKHGRKVRDEERLSTDEHVTSEGSTANAGPAASASYTTNPGHTASDAPTSDFGQRFTAQANDLGERISASASEFSERASKWGEDIGKQTDEWSARFAEQHDTYRLGAAHVVITLAFALLAAGGAALWTLNNGVFGANPNNLNVVIAATLGATVVFAISLIIAGIRGRHTGWVGFLAFCGVVALIATTIVPWGSRFQPFGIMEVGNEAPGAVLIAGSSRVHVDEFSASSSFDDVQVWHLAGNSVVTVPDDEPVVVTVNLLAGNISGPSLSGGSGYSAGPFLSRTFDLTEGKTAAAHVTVYMLGGNVRVEYPDGLQTTRSLLRSIAEDQAELNELADPALSLSERLPAEEYAR